MRTVNKVILIGAIAKELIVKTTGSGDALVSAVLVTEDRFKDKLGKQVSNPEWHKLIIFGKLAENFSRFIKKGSKVYIEGKINYSTYVDKNSVKQYVTQVKVESFSALDNFNKGAVDENNEPNGNIESAFETDVFDDDIPF